MLHLHDHRFVSDLVKNRDNIIILALHILMDGLFSNLRNYIVCLFYLRMVVCCHRSISRLQKRRAIRGLLAIATLKMRRGKLASFITRLNTQA